MNHRTLDIAVIGAGPTGLTLANLLGGYGIRTLLLERHASTVGEPRAVSIDDESLRTLYAQLMAHAAAQTQNPAEDASEDATFFDPHVDFGIVAAIVFGILFLRGRLGFATALVAVTLPYTPGTRLGRFAAYPTAPTV